MQSKGSSGNLRGAYKDLVDEMKPSLKLAKSFQGDSLVALNKAH